MKLSINLELAIDKTMLNSNVDTLCEMIEEISTKILPDEEMRLIKNKNNALYTKWIALNTMSAEILAYEKVLIRDYNPNIPIVISTFFSSKIEVFLTYSRSILEILAYSLGKILLQKTYQSINDLRKNRSLPIWLDNFFQDSTRYSHGNSQKKNGWLTNLVTCDECSGQSLRDFVSHRGNIDFVFAQDFDLSFYVCLKTRSNDNFSYAVGDLVNNIIVGINAFFEVIIKNLQT